MSWRARATPSSFYYSSGFRISWVSLSFSEYLYLLLAVYRNYRGQWRHDYVRLPAGTRLVGHKVRDDQVAVGELADGRGAGRGCGQRCGGGEHPCGEEELLKDTEPESEQLRGQTNVTTLPLRGSQETGTTLCVVSGNSGALATVDRRESYWDVWQGH